MLRSVAVLGVIVAAVAVFTAFLRDEPPDPTADVDYRSIAAQAREGAGFDLLAPADLPEGWRSNDARLEAGEPPAWHLGILTADDDYIGLEQQRASVRDMVARHAEGSRPDGTTEIAGWRWQVRTEAGADTTYVRHADGVTTLLTGDAPPEQIESYIGSLRAG